MRSRDAGSFDGRVLAADDAGRLAADVRDGLLARQATLPARFLYDGFGCALFDRICEAPEYYPTRTERGLLEAVAAEVARACGADELVELGSGEARKTDLLLDALGAATRTVRYVALDVSAQALVASARRLLGRYPRLALQAVVGDFTRDLGRLAPARGRLVAFLGGTVGNLEDDAAVALLRAMRGLIDRDGHVLLGADLVKDPGTIHAAYNDAAGYTRAFSLNAVARLQRDFQARLQLDDFRHEAFFDEAASRVEMHVRAQRRTSVVAPLLGVERALEAGESIRTEISRKFTPDALVRLFAAAGLGLVRLDVAKVPYALVLARPV